MEKRQSLIYLLGLIVLGLAGILLLKWTPLGQTIIWTLSADGTKLLPLLLASALIDSINPCAVSVLLLTIAFLLSLGAARGRVLAIGGAYILGIFIVYLLIGFGLLQVLHLFNTPHFMARVGAFLLIGLGAVNLISGRWPNFPLKLKIPTASHATLAKLMKEASLPAALLLGIVVGLCEFPCTGGPYLTAIGLLHDQATAVSGAVYLFLYNLVFILPLALILLLAGHRRIIAGLETWRVKNIRSLKLWSGLAMVLLGLIILNL